MVLNLKLQVWTLVENLQHVTDEKFSLEDLRTIIPMQCNIKMDVISLVIPSLKGNFINLTSKAAVCIKSKDGGSYQMSIDLCTP